jgi:hypothetical protein
VHRLLPPDPVLYEGVAIEDLDVQLLSKDHAPPQALSTHQT